MGRGDVRTRRGKIFAKSFGNRRPSHQNRKNKRGAKGSTHQAPATPQGRRERPGASG